MGYILLLFVLGVAVGCFGTLIGVGGGFILVPVFLLGFHWTPQQAAGTSLAIVCLNGISGSLAYIRQHKVHYNAALWFSLAALPGSFLGSYLSQYFTSASFRLVFGVLLAGLSVLMLVRPAGKAGAQGEERPDFAYNRPLGIGISVLVGFLSSILGIGGGLVHVPAMVYLLGFPPHIAAATSHLVLAVSSFFGATSHYLLGNVLLQPALIIGGGAVVGAQMGARLSQKVKSRYLLWLLAAALFLLGLRLAFTAYMAV